MPQLFGTVIAKADHFAGIEDELLGHLAGEFGDESAKVIADCYQGAFFSRAEWAFRELQESGAMEEYPARVRADIDFNMLADFEESRGNVVFVELPQQPWTVHVFSLPPRPRAA